MDFNQSKNDSDVSKMKSSGDSASHDPDIFKFVHPVGIVYNPIECQISDLPESGYKITWAT